MKVNRIYYINFIFILDVINEIKNSYYPNKCKYWMWPYNSKYNEQNYPDPMKYLIGFYYANKNVLKIINNNLTNTIIQT